MFVNRTTNSRKKLALGNSVEKPPGFVPAFPDREITYNTNANTNTSHVQTHITLAHLTQPYMNNNTTP